MKNNSNVHANEIAGIYSLCKINNTLIIVMLIIFSKISLEINPKIKKTAKST